MTRAATKPICCCRMAATVVQQPVVLPFDEAVERIRAFGALRPGGHRRGGGGETLGAGFALSTIRQPDALWVARLARNAAGAARRARPALSARARCQAAGWQSTCLTSRSFDPACRYRAAGGAACRLFCATPGMRPRSAHLLGHAGHLCLRTMTTVLCWRARPAGEAEILTLAVAPAARGRGLGRALVASRHRPGAGAGRRNHVPGSGRRQSRSAGALCRVGLCQGRDAQGLLSAGGGCAGSQASAARQIRLTWPALQPHGQRSIR